MPDINKPVTNAIGPTTATTPLHAADDERHHLSRLRVAVTLFFGLDGFVFAGWVVRIPAVKAQADASASALGLALLGVSAGAVVTMTLTGRLCKVFGARPVTVGCSALMSLAVALPAYTHSALTLGLVLVVFGVGYGGQNVAMNAVAVDLVAALRRPVISSFHAVYSLGGMLGAALGGLVASHLSPSVHLDVLAAIGLVATAVMAPFLLRGPEPSAPGTVRRGAPPPAPGGAGTAVRAGTGAVVLFGVIAGCTAYGEGSMSDWSALHLTQDLGAAPGLAAFGYSAFALAMTLGRLSGTAVQERFGQRGTLVVGGLTAAVGMLVGALAPVTWLVFAGFVVMGLGLSNIFPVAIGRAGALAGPNGVAVASTLGYGGLLIGPPAIGFLADWLSMPVALTTVSLLAAIAAVLGHAARDAGHRRARG
ncbi:MFS transporter [Streptomyces sp. NBC_01497]|uniref:MFS transporter n=1 Tax=Streptomyces sp. NBC_01497 TaxID=2903885 RepID=UPI002E334DAF|nr:MFS transporter [Streptomyces sp. NBC_01497]